MQETRVQPLDWEDPLEKGKATHFSILAWKIPWTESSMRLQRVHATQMKNFPQFVVIHTVKGFGIVNKAEIDVFLLY